MPRRLVLIASFCFLGSIGLSGCTSIAGNSENTSSEFQTGFVSVNSASQPSVDCAEILSKVKTDSESNGFDKQKIDLLSWNIKKGSEQDWQRDLEQLSNSKELVLLQEALEPMSAELDSGHTGLKSFTAGYSTKNKISGVATYSNIAPLGQCKMTFNEPWLRTPKAANITRFRLNGSDETLMVANIHMINFSLGKKHYQQQLAEIVDILVQHHGPVIVSGDFNTWSIARQTILQQQMQRLEAQAVIFQNDNRTKFWGQVVDYVYTSGLLVTEAGTQSVSSSDHNPMTLSLEVVM